MIYIFLQGSYLLIPIAELSMIDAPTFVKIICS